MIAVFQALNDQTPIAIGTGVAIVGGLGSVAWFMLRGLNDVKTEMALLKQTVETNMNGTVKRENLTRFLYKMKQLNPDLKMPEELP